MAAYSLIAVGAIATSSAIGDTRDFELLQLPSAMLTWLEVEGDYSLERSMSGYGTRIPAPGAASSRVTVVRAIGSSSMRT